MDGSMSMSMPKSLSNSAFLFKAECPANSWQKGKFRFGLPMDSDTSTEERNVHVRGCGLCGNQAPPANSWQKGKFRFGLPMDSDTSTEERNVHVRGCGLCGNQAPPSWHSVLKLVPVLGRRLVLVHDHELELSSWECA
eukprot:s7866_g2.t1